MAKRSSLFLRVIEGKKLPAKDLTGSSDPYCIVRIDNETIIRTATIWKTLSPFWGEEYNVHLPSTFHSISFYVMDEDAISRDDVIGKVSIAKEVLIANPKETADLLGFLYTTVSTVHREWYKKKSSEWQ